MSEAVAVAKAMRRLHSGICVPDYEKLLAQSYSRFLEPGHTVFDVGAHAALHLDRLAELVGAQGRVFAFEPIPGLGLFLARRFRGNKSVIIKPLAISNSAGMAMFKIVENSLAQSGLRRRDYGEGSAVLTLPSNWIAAGLIRRAIHAFGRYGIARLAFKRGWVIVREVAVEVDTIDAQAEGLQRLDYIKIDVEGGEMNCLRGAEKTIERLRPFISVEYGHPGYSPYGETAMTLFSWARRHHYLVADLFGNIIEEETDWLNICDVSYWDYFVFPEERRDFWQSRFSS